MSSFLVGQAVVSKRVVPAPPSDYRHPLRVMATGKSPKKVRPL